MIRGCITCEGWFLEDTDEETINVLKKHIEKCTKETPFLDDENIKGFI